MRRCLLALLLALVCADPTHAQTQPEVRKIRFSGAQSFDVELLRAAIISDQTSCKVFVFCDKQYLDPVGLSGDIVRLRLFYYQRGYRKATIQLDTTRSASAPWRIPASSRRKSNGAPRSIRLIQLYAAT